MRLDLCAVAFGLLLFSGSAQNWAQERGKDIQTKPSAEAADPTSTKKPPAKFSDEDVAAEFKRLTGSWRPKSGELAGEKFSDEVCKQITLELTNGRYKSTFNGEESSGTIKLDLSKEPRGMDITIEDGEDAGKTIKCVYKLEDDTLHVAYSLAFDEVRPTKFESNQDNKLLLIVYEHSDEPAKPNGQQTASPKSPRDK